MKIVLLLLICFTTAARTFAQAPVNNINWLPSAGDEFYFYRINYTQTTNPYIDPGDTGAYVVWDFNEKRFFLNYPTDSITFTTPAAISVTPLNSQANLATGNSAGYVLYIKNSVGLSATQSYSKSINNPEFPINYRVSTNPRINFRNNFRFRESYQDTVVFYSHSQYSLADSPSRGHALSLTKYDGFGTLNVANLTFNNVIRTIEQRQQWDRTSHSNKFYSFAKIFTWHDSIHKNGLLTYIEAYSINLANVFDTTFYASLTLQLPVTYLTNINAPLLSSEQVSAFFHNNEIRIISQKDIGSAQFTLLDIQGRIIKQGKFHHNQQSIKLDNLPQGIYLLKLEEKNSFRRTFKLVKQ